MKTLKERIEIEQAYLDGKEIDFKVLGSAAESWYKVTKNEKDIVFRWDFNDYRINPKPLEFWVNVYEDGFLSDRYDSKEVALRGRAFPDDYIKTIKVREVIE